MLSGGVCLWNWCPLLAVASRALVCLPQTQWVCLCVRVRTHVRSLMSERYLKRLWVEARPFFRSLHSCSPAQQVRRNGASLSVIHTRDYEDTRQESDWGTDTLHPRTHTHTHSRSHAHTQVRTHAHTHAHTHTRTNALGPKIRPSG